MVTWDALIAPGYFRRTSRRTGSRQWEDVWHFRRVWTRNLTMTTSLLGGAWEIYTN